MRRMLFALLLLSFVMPTVAAAPGSTTNEAGVGGILFYRARTDFAGRTSEQRAAQVQQRLNRALSQGPIQPSDITVGQVEGDCAVLLKGRRFLTVDPETARVNHSNPPALAAKWAKMLQKTLPALTRPTNITHAAHAAARKS